MTDFKELYRTAIIAAPLMAIFEISPFMFLSSSKPLTAFQFIFTFFFVFIIWLCNVKLIKLQKSIYHWSNRVRYFLSFVATLSIATLLSILQFYIVKYEFSNITSIVILSIINIVTLNTIVLITLNSILLKQEKILTNKELDELRIKQLESDLQQLNNQLQPHFLFNSLSTLKSLLHLDTILAEKYILLLSGFLRYTLVNKKFKTNTLRIEFNFAKDYIKMQKIRFDESFFAKLEVPEDILNLYRLPSYSIQILVENALKHNAFTPEKPLLLSIIFQNDQLIVSNNKIYKKEILHSRTGLENLKKRYQLLFNQTIIIEDTDTTFTVHLPLNKL